MLNKIFFLSIIIINNEYKSNTHFNNIVNHKIKEFEQAAIENYNF